MIHMAFGYIIMGQDILKNELMKKLGKVILYVTIGFLWFILLLILALHIWAFFWPDMNQVKKLGQNYAISYSYRDTYNLTYYTIGYQSSAVPLVVKDAIHRLEYDRRWIFFSGMSGKYWVIDKTIPNGKVRNGADVVRYDRSVIGPLDSVSFVAFKDSVEFKVESPENVWLLECHR